MKKISDLKLGFSDAINYKKRENRFFFSNLFVRTADLDNVLNRTNYFIVGDKGTGKTALSVFLSTNEMKNHSSQTKFIGETEYKKFIRLKDNNQISLSDFEDVWVIILYLLIAKQIRKRENDNVIFSKFSKFKALDDAIENFYNKAFSPEVSHAINFVNNADKAAKLVHDSIELGLSVKKSKSYTETNFQLNLLYLKKEFEVAISSLNLEYNHILFIDGIDLRPSKVPYEEYLDCIKGLVHAAWKINTDFFANIKGSKGRIKAMLLMRPDIFNSVGLQNMNSKIKDNSVLLDWKTTYRDYRTSNIFKIIDNLLASQQESNNLKEGEAWDYYFPYKVYSNGFHEDSFVSFLRYSMFKPRDIVTMLQILQENFNTKNVARIYPVFSDSDFTNPDFFRKYSDYLLGEIYDYVSFYHSKEDYELLIKFFEFMEGSVDFNYDEYLDIYGNFANYVEKNDIQVPVFFESSDKFLQFLYEMNVLCFIEKADDGKKFFRWSFRERSMSNPNPKVKEGVDYFIHYGLTKAIKVGKKLKRRKIRKR